MTPARVVLLPLLFTAPAVACSSPTDCAAVSTMVLGQWIYSASRTQPVANLTGTLTIQPGCPNFQGALAGTQVDDVGQVTPFNVVVVGQMLDSTSVVFDAYFGTTGRHHMGRVAHDSITGIWVDQSSGGAAGAGSFVAAKENTP
jgi:hypothetical protein